MNQAQLIGGRMVDSNSEDWRIECEARSILRLPFEQRRAWLEQIEKRRGKEAADKLKEEIGRVWESKR